MDNIIYKRLIIDNIEKYLYTDDIIVLHGARQVGKTCILNYIRNDLNRKNSVTHYIDLEDSRFVRILDEGVDEFIKYLGEEGFNIDEYRKTNKKIFVFVDEIQYLSNPSSFLKLTKDHHPYIKLIVSGSSTFAIKKKFKDSLAGRTIDFEIFNLSFEEFLLFKQIHFERNNIYTDKKRDELISLYEEFSLYGGYPKIVLTNDISMKEKYIQQIIDTYIKKDIRDLAAIKDINKFNRLLEILASQSGSLLNVTELSNTVGISKQTIEEYIFLLEQTYIIHLVRPFSTNIRSELTKTPKIFFYDTGLMQMLWLKELQKELLGEVFETSIFAELAKKHGTKNIFYWRTMDKKEIDFIVREKRQLLPVEVKLNFAQFHTTAIDYFCNKYGITNFKLAGLKGIQKNPNHIYPWQL